MKFSTQSCLLFGLVMTAALAPAQEVKKKDDAPVAFPKLEHFAALWERSVFTTKDLPSPDAPSGPNFADNYNLSGVYEFDGAVTFVLVDRTTSQFMEARIGAENEYGIKVRAVKQGETVEKTRVQLQKGDQAGWVSFADASAAPAEVVQKAVIPTQQTTVQGRRVIGGVPAGGGLPPNPILPPPSVPVPGTVPQSAAPKVNDVPLPPP